jgi:hypothetical protein
MALGVKFSETYLWLEYCIQKSFYMRDTWRKSELKIDIDDALQHFFNIYSLV